MAETETSLLPVLQHALPGRAPIPRGVDVVAIRAMLPLQQVPAFREMAQAAFGLAYGDVALARTLITFLPPKWLKTRAMRCVPITLYQNVIPDAALLRWQQAKESAYFSDFCVAEPVYLDREVLPVSPDPWLIGWVKTVPNPAVQGVVTHTHGHIIPKHWKGDASGRGHGIVLAYWE